MTNKIKYTLTQSDVLDIRAAMDYVAEDYAADLFSGGDVRQQRVNAAWQRVAVRHQFKWDTVEIIPMSDQCLVEIYAEPDISDKLNVTSVVDSMGNVRYDYS